MTDIRVNMPEDLKSKVQLILKDNDLTISQAVRMFFKEIEKNRGLPFNPFGKELNEETIAAIEASMNPENLESFESVEALFCRFR
ncbi:MAG: type II toxin-antitoxin system RelB/DinJ family antitoxin [Saprospiraceae bacterium]|nr:type II toxin-antitoxin system RelB/DinJ family antitoxin [Saprospiraceae bacterium]